MKAFLSHLASKWYIYLLWAAFAVLLWGWIFGLVTRPSEKQKLTLFVGANSCEQAVFSDLLDKNKPEYIVRSRLDFYREDDFNFSMFLTVKSPETDLFVLSYETLEEIGTDRFLSFNADEGRKLFGDGAQFLVKNGAAVGIKVYDKTEKKGCAAEYIGYGGCDYYMLFNKNSPHTGGLGGVETDAAIRIAGWFLKL